MPIPSIRTWWALAILLITLALAWYLPAQQWNSLIIDGQTGSAKVIQVNGHSYVEVEGIARLTNSSIRFNGTQVVLTLPGNNPAASAPVAPATGFSKNFVTAGIEAMAQIREWHSALKNAIEGGYPIAEGWLARYRAQAQQALRLASVAVSTPADRNAFPFVTFEFNNMSKLSDNYLNMTKNMNYIAPNSLANDPLDQRILACAHSLASMATTNQFVDDGSCQ